MDITAYLTRLNYNGSLEPTLATLTALHQAHLLAVPFENLDIHLGRPIILDEESLFNKIVGEQRGGFCYELNGLFAALLRDLGYQVTYLSARVINREGVAGPEFDHLALRVDLDKPYLVDVGFGDGFLRPLELYRSEPQFQDGRFYRIKATEKSEAFILEQREEEAEWEGCYLFTLTPYQFQDFAAMCHYQQTSPLSAFTRRKVAIRRLPQGLVKLRDWQLFVETSQQKQEQSLQTQEEYLKVLREFFGIKLNQFNSASLFQAQFETEVGYTG
jgi:N-hydroxyarylamine O-acetyltransferase